MFSVPHAALLPAAQWQWSSWIDQMCKDSINTGEHCFTLTRSTAS